MPQSVKDNKHGEQISRWQKEEKEREKEYENGTVAAK